MEKIHDTLNRKLNEISKQSIHKLITELETGGNIRFHYNKIKNLFYFIILHKYKKYRLEEGKGEEKWYVSCIDLLRSRFHAEEMG